MIQPTVGRKVWYFPYGNTGQQPHDATIVNVNSNLNVNLACHDEFGASYAVRSVYLLPSDGSVQNMTTMPHAEWMPYQAAQAKSQELSQ